MRNKEHPESQMDYCGYYGVPCKDITHCTIDYERCSAQPIRGPGCPPPSAGLPPSGDTI